ncbi:MAG: hypothetical protein ACI4RH_11635 [Huintestinicola sp.]
MNTEILHNETAEPTLVQTENKKLVNKSEKVAERLIALREKLDKSVEAQTAAEKKTKGIRTEIAKCEKYLHDEEVRILDSVCSKNMITYAEVTAFIEAVTEKMSIPDAAEILGVKM